MKSRRKFRRLAIMGLGRLILEGERKSQEVYVANLSRGGAGVYMNKALKLNTPLALSFRYTDPSGDQEMRSRPGIVAWCKRFGGVYALGIRFTD